MEEKEKKEIFNEETKEREKGDITKDSLMEREGKKKEMGELEKTEKIIEMLLFYNCDPNIKNNKGDLPLHSLCSLNFEKKNFSVDLFNKVLEKSDQKILGKKNNTILHLLCKNKKMKKEIIHSFFNSPSSSSPEWKELINIPNDKQTTPFHYACANPLFDVQIILLFLQNNANLERRNNTKKNAIHFAINNTEISEDVIKLLLLSNADPNSIGESKKTPLHLACKNEKITRNIIESLLTFKADLNFRSNNLNTPILFATLNPSVDSNLISYLLSMKADPLLKNRFERNALHNACKTMNLGIIKLLCSPETVNIPSQRQNYPLHILFSNKVSDPLIVRHLIQQKANPHFLNKREESVIELAFQNNCSYEVLRELILGYNDINYKAYSSENTPLLLSLSTNNVDERVIELILEQKGDPNILSNIKESALFRALKNDSIPSRIVELLIQKKASVYTKIKNKTNCFEYACSQRNIPVEKLIPFFPKISSQTTLALIKKKTLKQIQNCK
eukprot:TRINITY_DN12544_c0_g1_i1.p1 TRINITY_DN12544_c0_g1~~TRINITY_DN12544_c0_g1_i1.p1  ORF type:complete len:524 (-),score=168.48 TRINITY_DN12544_c0_g1_i1:192-1703(-)